MDISDLPLRPNQLAFVNRLAEACQSDERVVAAFLGGSYAKGYSDPYSDLDVCVITTDQAFEDFSNERGTFLRALGDLVFLESFGNPDTSFFIYTDDTEGELNFASESRLHQIHSGTFITLVDKKNILADAVFPPFEPPSSGQLEKLRGPHFRFLARTVTFHHRHATRSTLVGTRATGSLALGFCEPCAVEP